MTRRIIDEAEFRALVAAYPLYIVAERLDLSRRTVSVLAARYGLTSAFGVRKATAAEDASIQALAAQGHSVSHIAAQIGRSHEFVARRLNGDAPPVRESETARRPRSGAWPIPDTTIGVALDGRHYEDVAREVLDRECPPGRWPINGAALASVGRFAATSYTRSTADLCADA